MENEIRVLQQTIDELKKENDSLKVWQNEITKVMQKMITNSENMHDSIEKLRQYAYINRIRIESMPYELRDTEYKSPIIKPKVLSEHDTRMELIKDKRSFSRFGDGEFAIIAGIGRWNFQAPSEKLAEKLLKILKTEDEGILIGLQKRFYGNLEEYSEAEADGVRHYMRPEIRKQHSELINPNRIYGETLFHEIKNDQELAELKLVWDNRMCVFIEGEHTGLGVGNDLFDNCQSIERIIAPAENAIDRYEDIMEASLKQPKEKLFLIALGPTATALAYDLYKEGYQAIDLGHADLSYEKYLRKLDKLEDVSIPYKYCSWDELGERRVIEEIQDKEYKKQIVDRIN